MQQLILSTRPQAFVIYYSLKIVLYCRIRLPKLLTYSSILILYELLGYIKITNFLFGCSLQMCTHHYLSYYRMMCIIFLNLPRTQTVLERDCTYFFPNSVVEKHRIFMMYYAACTISSELSLAVAKTVPYHIHKYELL